MTDNAPDYDDPKVEDAWCDERRREVAAYLAAQRLTHGRIGDWPAWHVAPVVSVWAIESHATPGAIGWWVISGDVPTDYLSAESARDPREAVRAFAGRWSAAAEAIRQGHGCPIASIGANAEERRSLGPMLESRAKLLGAWAERDDIWDVD